MQDRVSLTLLFVLSCSIHIFAQIDLRKYFTGDVIPFVQPHEYPDLAITWDMPGSIQASLNAAMTELKEKNYRPALANFNEVINLDRNSGPAHYYRAVTHKAMLHFDSATTDFTKAFRIGKSWQAAEQLGEIYLTTGDGLKAKEWLQKSLKIKSNEGLTLYQLAILEFRKGNMDESIKILGRCHDADPKFASAYVMQGLILQHKNKGKLTASLPYFMSAVKADSTNKLGLFWRGLTYATMNKRTESLADFDKLVSLNPGVPFFLLLRGFLNIELYRYDFAFNDLRKAILSTSAPEDNFKGGQTLLDKQLDIQFATSYALRFSYGLDPDALKHFRKGFCLFLADRKSEALTSFQHAEILQPSATVYFMKAITLEHQGNHGAALENYTKALELDNDIFDAHKKRGIYRTELKDYEGALEDFKDMIRLEPNLIQTYRLRGFTRIHQGDYAGAAEDLLRYAKFDSTDAEVLVNIAYAYDQQKKYVEAGKYYVTAARVGNAPGYYDAAFTALVNSGDTTQLLLAYAAYAHHYPYEPDPVHRQIRVYIGQKNWKKANDEIERVIRMTEDRNFPGRFVSTSYLLRGLYFLQQGNARAALKWFPRAKRADAANLEADYLYAIALSKLGEVRKALTILQELKANKYPGAEKEHSRLLAGR